MWRSSSRFVGFVGAVVLVGACGADDGLPVDELPDIASDGKADGTAEPLNAAAADWIIYELQVRSANACDPDTGGAACLAKPVPQFAYHGPGCSSLRDLQDIRKSTLDDLVATTTGKPTRTNGITLQYVKDAVGANAVWLMPLFPHNFEYDLPDACDDLGSPYAVRDYFHARGTLARRCIAAGKDEWSSTECWGNTELKKVITAAHAKGMKVMLDLAFNHFGHEYRYYDYADAAVPVRDRLARGENLWDFTATYDAALVNPVIFDTSSKLTSAAKTRLKSLCGVAPTGSEAVRRWLMYREAFDYERSAMDCRKPATLENQVPGFYLGRNGRDPSTRVGDNFTNDWRDVKFLYNNEGNAAHAWEFARTREYAFRVVNYWLSQGVDGFRLDHANGLTENEWRYIFRKARYYQTKRQLPAPVFLSESFSEITSLARVFDVLTEGYHHDISNGRRWARDLEATLFTNRDQYLGPRPFVLLNMENHDEGRLLKSSTGFDTWRGATFYALMNASRGVPELLTGQEWGEPWDLGFRRSDYLRGRFPTERNWSATGDQLTTLYKSIHDARLSAKNVALRRGEKYFPRTMTNTVNDQLFAMVKYMPDCSNTMFTFFRLWVNDVTSTYAVNDELARRICLSDTASYRLVDALTGKNVWQTAYPGGTRTGRDMKQAGVYVHLGPAESFQYLRLEKI